MRATWRQCHRRGRRRFVRAGGGAAALRLPAEANIIQFQRRFTLTPAWSPGDKDIAQFVFRRGVADLGSVPQRTTLQRAIMTHLRGGGHWRRRTGWLNLSEAAAAAGRADS